MRTKVVSFFIFSRAYKQKKFKALRPKMAKIASRGGGPALRMRFLSGYCSFVVGFRGSPNRPTLVFLQETYSRLIIIEKTQRLTSRLWTLSLTLTGICTHPYTGTRAFHRYVCTHVLMPLLLGKLTAPFQPVSSPHVLSKVNEIVSLWYFLKSLQSHEEERFWHLENGKTLGVGTRMGCRCCSLWSHLKYFVEIELAEASHPAYES